MSNDNRQRVSIPIRGLDTSSTDINAPDGAMQELHNLRYSGEAWRNVKPFKVFERAMWTLLPNKIFRDFDTEDNESYIVSQFPVASDINITAYWWDVDGEYTSTTSATLKAGMSRVHIKEAQEIFGWIELNIQSDDKYIYYTNRDGVPESIIDWEVVYQHPADDDDVYVGKRLSADKSSCELLRVRIKDWVFTILSVIAEGVPADIKISHFGNVLIVFSDGTPMRYFIKSGDTYKQFTSPKPPAIHHSTELSTTGEKQNRKCTKLIPAQYNEENHFTVPLYSLDSGSFMIPSFEAGGFWGEICYFAVFQMQGGELIAPGALNISASELFSHRSSYTKYTTTVNYTTKEIEAQMMVPDLAAQWNDNRVDVFSDSISIKEENYNYGAGAKYPMVIPWAFFISPYIQITIPDIDTDIIKSVQIYSTRINPIWDGEKLKSVYESRRKTVTTDIAYTVIPRGESTTCFADNKLPEQPFYLMKDIPISEFKDGVFEMYITSEMLNGIEQKKTYNALDPHSLICQGTFEYNERIHSTGSVETHLFGGFGMDFFDKDANTDRFSTVEIRRNTDSYFVDSEAISIPSNPIPSKILSYPDYTAHKLYNSYQETSGAVVYSLKPAQANNYAYETNELAVGDESNFEYSSAKTSAYRYVKYDIYFVENLVPATHPRISFDNNVIKSTNTLRVSAPNNPFVWPLANSYAIGTEENEIITVNSAAIEMSDSKFGEFPLYAFTKEGVFALQSGTGEVLYGAIVPLNYDQIINPNTLAVNYNVLYITNRGVHALYSNEASLISEPINDSANRPLLDFLRTAQMAYQHKYGEVIIFNEDAKRYPHAYTFSLGSKVWATRDWHESGEVRRMLNNGKMISQDEYGSIFFYDINDENSPGKSSLRLVSRPIKFSTQEFKRIETMVTRLQASPAEYLDIKIEGSNDLVHWATLRDTTTQTASDVNIRRTPCSCRYFRVSINCTTMSDVAIMGFDFEYYMRFLHRMR